MSRDNRHYTSRRHAGGPGARAFEGQEAEEQRRRAAGETDLLERDWPEEEEALEDGSALSRWLDTARSAK